MTTAKSGRLALLVGGGPAPAINGIISNIAEDARTTGRWYVVVSMGRAAGHLALGIGKAAAATVTIIPEEFQSGKVSLDEVCDILIGSVLKRRAKGSHYGVAILAE